MVAIVISSLLIIGVTEVFSRSFFADRDNSELTYMQESGRLALELIGQDARRAGFQGCVPADTITAFPDGTSLPGAAISTANVNSLTFRYVRPGTGCGTVAPIFEDAVTYSNNANGGISRNNDPILDNASIGFSFAPEADNPITATAVRVNITVTDSGTSPTPLDSRTFSATFEIRNRLQ